MGYHIVTLEAMEIVLKHKRNKQKHPQGSY